jgi:hypothetical protein
MVTIVRALAGLVMFLSLFVPVAAQGQEIKVTLLGTGSPAPVMNRLGRVLLLKREDRSSYSMPAGVPCNASPK